MAKAGRKAKKKEDKLATYSIYVKPAEWEDFVVNTEENQTHPSEELREYIAKYNKKNKKKKL